jgi:Curlin associated repeat
MKMKLAFATATALGLVMGAAYAGSNNKSYIDQIGQGNEAFISQTGDNNQAGVDTTKQRIRQDGSYNLLTIDQQSNLSGFTNQPDQRGAKAGTGPNGIDQIGNRNELSITQNAGTVAEVQQTSTGASSTHVGTTNKATIEQDKSDSNVISQVLQTFLGAGAQNDVKINQSTTANGTTGNSVSKVSQTGAGNSIDIKQRVQWNAIGEIKQDGIGNTFTVEQEHQFVGGTGGNLVTLGDQKGNGNNASVSQFGAGNKVLLVRQNSTGKSSGNSAVIELKGANNGLGGLDGAAGLAGAASSSVDQIGGGNAVEYHVLNGNDNQFGFYQSGDGNKAVGIYINGSRNQLGVNQIGYNNKLTLGTVTGSDNNLGLVQWGSDNTATVSISGDFNGTGSFTGFAQSVASAKNLKNGLIKQTGPGLSDGSLNEASLIITNSNNNMFAYLQSGDKNKISGEIKGGNGNQVAVAQNGNSNIAVFTQTGGGNNLGITQ